MFTAFSIGCEREVEYSYPTLEEGFRRTPEKFAAFSDYVPSDMNLMYEELADYLKGKDIAVGPAPIWLVNLRAQK